MNDLIELSPERSPERWEALVTAIGERAAPLLAERRRKTLAGTLAGWSRPGFTVAAGLAAAAVAVLALLPGAARDELLSAADAEITLAEAMVPWSVAAWMDGSYAPTAPELVADFEEYVP